MRLLITIGSDKDGWIPRLCTHGSQLYAILSHRWLEDPNQEVLFADIREIDQIVIGSPEDQIVSPVINPQYTNGDVRIKPGFAKLQGAARQALRQGYEYLWIDTCCIDKGSSAELSEAINSMFKWYKASSICYAYLVDVPGAADAAESSHFAASQWWKRGWTLQELVAPREVMFLASDWTGIGCKRQLGTTIASITGINTRIFSQELVDINRFSIAQRMSWASARTTTRPEDMAYCLMGLFDVNMPILYGEGEKAFIRLQQEIIKESDDESIFAWRDEPTLIGTYSGMLATRPAAFAGSQDVERVFDRDHGTPFSMTNKGLSITLPLLHPLPWVTNHKSTFLASLRCTTSSTNEKCLGVFLRKMSPNGIQYVREKSQHWIDCVPSSECGETTTIFAKQSWSELTVWLNSYQMAVDIMASTSTADEGQETASRSAA